MCYILKNLAPLKKIAGSATTQSNYMVVQHGRERLTERGGDRAMVVGHELRQLLLCATARHRERELERERTKKENDREAYGASVHGVTRKCLRHWV